MPPDTIGYMAVICPKIDFWQAYYIIDNENMRVAAEKSRKVAQELSERANIPVKSVLLGGIVEAALSGNETLVGATALLLRETDSDFFYIEATRESHGTYSSVVPLLSTTPDAARSEIENLPEVLAIKQRLLDKLSLRDGSGRRRAFH